MTNIAKGMFAGLAATVVLSLLMLMKGAMGLMPALDLIGMIAMMMGVSTAIYESIDLRERRKTQTMGVK